MPVNRSARHPVLGPVVALTVLSGLLVGCASAGSDSSPSADPAPVSTSSVDAPANTSSSSSTSSTPTSTTTSTSTTTTTAVPVDPTTVAEPDGPLQSGSKGLRTRALQQALKDQHYDPGTVDGAFGGQVRMSVWAFQALHGLPKDGVVDADLEALILSRPVQPMLRPELGPTHTEVDLTRQVLMVFRDGSPTLITHVSSGSQVPYCEDTEVGQNCGEAVTPEGIFKYERRIDGWRDAPLGRLYKPVYFRGGFAVHGAGSVPDHPASHGCVRTPMHIAEYFPALVADGDTIEIYRS